MKDYRSFLAIILSALIYVGWYKFYYEPNVIEPAAQAQKAALVQKQSQQSALKQEEVASSVVAVTQAQESDTPVRTEKTATALGEVTLSNEMPLFKGAVLKNYQLESKAGNVDLGFVTHSENGQGFLGFDAQELAYLSQVKGTLALESDGSIKWYYEDANIRIQRLFKATLEQNDFDATFEIEFKAKRPNYVFVTLQGSSTKDDVDHPDRQLLHYWNKELSRTAIDDSMKLQDVGFGVEWIGVTNRYFLTALIPQGELKPKALIQPISAEKGRVSLVYPVTESTIRIPLKGFFGPKELNILKSVDRRLDPALDLGFFTWFAYPLLKLLKFFEGWTANWGVAIILLTLLVKILTYPLTYKSMKSMKKMAALQPKLQKLREKYADDKEALNREMLVLMKEGGYNPAAGCLPILIQMPVFFALYRVLYSSIELYQAPFFLWITDLSTKDPFYITPVVLTAVMYVQQKLTPNTATDPVQAKMMQFMPVMFGVFMVSLPSGLTLYMLVNALASIAQQIILNKKLGTTGASVTQARA